MNIVFSITQLEKMKNINIKIMVGLAIALAVITFIKGKLSIQPGVSNSTRLKRPCQYWVNIMTRYIRNSCEKNLWDNTTYYQPSPHRSACEVILGRGSTVIHMSDLGIFKF